MDELPTSIPLTPDLSRTLPDIYKEGLFYLLDNSTLHGRRALDFVMAERNLSYDKITLDPTRWQSGHDMELGTITLGTAPMTQEEKMFNFPFETNSFTDERIMVYKFAHELSHFLGEAIADKIEGGDTNPHLKQYEAFMRSFTNFRKAGKGVSSHAGDQRYVEKGPEIQAVEDMTDLLAFYLVDPQYLDRYLKFLSDPDPLYEEIRTKHHLMTLPKQITELMGRNISQVVDLLLVDKKEKI